MKSSAILILAFVVGACLAAPHPPKGQHKAKGLGPVDGTKTIEFNHNDVEVPYKIPPPTAGGEEEESRTVTVSLSEEGEEEEGERAEATEEEERCCSNECASACSGRDFNNYTCTCRNCFGCVCGSYSCATFG